MYTTDKENAIFEALHIPTLVASQATENDAEKLQSFLRALMQYIERSSDQATDRATSSSSPLHDLKLDQPLANPELQQAFQFILMHMVTASAEKESLLPDKQYTTGDLSRFFGVSIATINNWIQKGKIVGAYKQERFKQARIPESAIYLSSTGANMTIQEAAELYHTEQKRTPIQLQTPIAELKEWIDTVYHYEQKYGGALEHIQSSLTEVSAQQERDFTEWRYLLNRLQERGL